MPTRFLALALMMILFAGCSTQRQIPDAGSSTAPAKTITERLPDSSPQYAPGYEDKESKAKVPENACHPHQRVIAVFRNGSNVCFINGREYAMEGTATIKKHENLLPFKYIAVALGVPGGYSFNPEKNSITLHFRGNDYRFGGQLGEDGVLYTRTPRNLENMDFGILWDHHAGRFEILDPLPLTAEDQKIGELYLGMTIEKVISMLGPPKSQDQYYSHVFYPDYTFENAFSDEQPNIIMVRNNQIATPRGLKVGDSLNKVFELYGRGYSRGFGYAQPDIFEYHFPQNVRKQGYLSFEVDENNRVKEIVINGISFPHYQVTR